MKKKVMHHLRFEVQRPAGENSTDYAEAQFVVHTDDSYSAMRDAVRHLLADGWKISKLLPVTVLSTDEIDQQLRPLADAACPSRLAYETLPKTPPPEDV